MNKILALSLALVTAQSAATTSTIEVSLFYPQEYETDSSLNLPVEIVGFYRSIELGNELLARDGVNIKVKPTSIQATDEWGVSETISNGINLMNFNSSVDPATNVGDVAVGLFKPDFIGLAAVNKVNATDYIDWPNTTRKMAMGSNNMLGRDSKYAYEYILTHELLHTMGGMHDKELAEIWSENGMFRDDGHGVTCPNGVNSLLHESGHLTPFEEVTISGSPKCQHTDGNNVAFANHYAPMVANYAPVDISDQTLKVSATENLNTNSFDIKVTRTDTSTSETMKLYVAGGSAATADNHINPIDVVFENNATVSQIIAIPFNKLYPLFNQADGKVNSVYAVAVGEREISDSTLDLMALSTDWTKPNLTPDSPETPDTPNTPETPTEENTPSSGGGSMPIWGLLFLPFLNIVRRKS